MSDKPIIFSSPMITALLDGRKSQTRRVIEPCKDKDIRSGDIIVSWPADQFVRQCHRFRPRFLKEDRIWVKEAWKAFASQNNVKPSELWHSGCCHGAGIMYEADQRGLAITKDGERFDGPRDDPKAFGKLRSPMFMPKWASRITLIVEDVDIQRVQDITANEALAEGVECTEFWDSRDVEGKPFEEKWWDDATFWSEYPQLAFRSLWGSINGKRPNCGWENNPWCAVYKFRTVLANIDMLAEVVDDEAS